MKKSSYRCGLALLVGAMATVSSWAHAVRHDIAIGDAVVVALRYTDGAPFAFERYELFHGPATEPVQSGRTDARGRLVLLPGEAGVGAGWRLRAFSAEGHGIDTPLQLGSLPQHDGVASADADQRATASGWERIALGVAAIFGLGLALQQALRRGRSA